MGTGQIRRAAGRGAAALLLACLAVVAGALARAPRASAATTVPVHIRDLTPPLVSINAGDSVAFDDQIQDKTVQVGGGSGLLPSTLTVVVHTDVTLGLPDDQPKNQHVLKPGDPAFVQKFTQTCTTCTITYTYRAEVPGSSLAGSVLNAVTTQAIASLPQNQVVTYAGKQTTVTIGVPTPFLVNTLVPLPNLPGVNLPQLPTVQVPTTVPGVGNLPGVQVPGGTTFVTTTTTTTTTRRGIAGQQYTYLTGVQAPAMAPQPGGTAAFDPSSIGSAAGGSGPAQPGLADRSATSTVTRSASSPLSVPALAAVIALAGVLAALARVQQLSRRGARR